MEMAKVTSKGQITIPISIRRRLGINEGDKILFINKQDGVMMLNPDTVQGDVSDYTADDLPLDAPIVQASGTAAASTATPSPAPKRTAASKPVIAIDSEPEEDAAEEVPEPATAVQPPRRKYIAPVESEPADKPKQAGGIDLSTILDDIRSIGNI